MDTLQATSVTQVPAGSLSRTTEVRSRTLYHRRDKRTGKAPWVKVYVRLADGTTKFHKDAYRLTAWGCNLSRDLVFGFNLV
jgi:hypothetical protein